MSPGFKFILLEPRTPCLCLHFLNTRISLERVHTVDPEKISGRTFGVYGKTKGSFGDVDFMEQMKHTLAPSPDSLEIKCYPRMTVSETLMLSYSRHWRTLGIPDDTGGPAVPFASTIQCCTFHHSDLPRTVGGQEDKTCLWRPPETAYSCVILSALLLLCAAHTSHTRAEVLPNSSTCNGLLLMKL